MKCLLHKRIERHGSNHRDINSQQFIELFLYIGDGGWNPIFKSQKFLVHCFKDISHIEAVMRIIRIAKMRIVNLRGVSTNRGLTRRGRGRGTKMAVGGFINVGNIHSLMGWGTKIITVVWQWMKMRIGSEIISTGNIHSLIRQGR